MQDSEHSQIMYKLGEIQGQISGMEKRFDGIDELLTNHDKSIRILDTFKDASKGQMVVIGTIVAGVMTALFAWIGKHL